MKIRNVEEATKLARKVIGNPTRFLPTLGKMENKHWIIKAIIGTIDDIEVTVKLPEEIFG